jgi:outer membrane biosynthesis protein TonB
MRLHSTHTRDSSLRKLSVINRWLIAASVTLTGVLTDVAAHAFPSKSTHSTTKAGKHNSAKAQTSTPSHKLNPPAEAPQATTESPASAEPAPESAPAEEPVPAEPTPQREAAPQAAPEAAPEAAPAKEAPVEEPSAPVVSGGS